ncbi:MAG: methyltransferase domain-containing protein [Phyllobacteriaceae bacterium]|nr:methyltransferase domain-containing protein [Phyllobacteriaceae bacterium]
MNETTDALADAYNAALAHEKAGETAEAAELYRQCLALDPADRCGAAMRLASIGMGDAPDKAADAYVATLFDQHAEDFDDILTGALGYAVPMQAAQWLTANRPGPYARLLDLGCGTGLAGMMLMELCEHATGVDIAEQMVEKADERAAYDALYVNEAVHFLGEWARSDAPEHAPFDLIVATDVLPYIGALESFFDGIAANAAGKARLVVSAETLPALADGPKDWMVTPHQRFAHSAAYLEAMCARAGFTTIELFEPITVRLEQGAPIPGFLVVAARG